MTLHIFNPDTDYALASNSENYTPPVSILAVKSSLMLLPALYADRGDAILLPNDNPGLLTPLHPFAEFLSTKNITLVRPRHLKLFVQEKKDLKIRPWGWNRTLCKWLSSLGAPEHIIPSAEEMTVLRNLSHRKLTIPFLLNMKDVINDETQIPKEFTDVEDALEFWSANRLENREVYFKAPWSSSGRGLQFTKDLEKRHIEPWLRGIIRSQGSVMGEIAYSRSLDFATEWECQNGKAMFLGVSTFITSERGKYKSNVVAPQENIVAYILQHIDVYGNGNNLSAIIERQRLLLENYVAPYYEGPLGIDMLVTEDRNINPCVEINLRDTMGRVAIDIQQRIISQDATEFEVKCLRHLTAGGIFSPMSIISTLRDIESN